MASYHKVLDHSEVLRGSSGSASIFFRSCKFETVVKIVALSIFVTIISVIFLSEIFEELDNTVQMSYSYMDQS